MRSDEYYEGREAYYLGLYPEDNPYAHTSVQSDEWLKGWWDADHDDRNMYGGHFQ